MSTNTILLLIWSWPKSNPFLKEHTYTKNMLLFFNISRIFWFLLLSLPTLMLLFNRNEPSFYRILELVLYALALYLMVKKIRVTLSVSKRKRI